jgi:DNA-binding CsgD family transcriptional regulator/tetratricopeptide (TPR) repeat protein/type II secretory pathway predicted ATPase ExeA
MQADGFRDGSVLLERAEQMSALHESLGRVIERSRSGVVLVPGEAGGGKTALLRRFCADAATRARVFSAACDPLFNPRPFGPLLELAGAVTADLGQDGELAAQVAAAGDAFDVATALLRELRLAAPAVVVIEDVHWADEATLDVVRLLARRAGAVRLLLVLSYRDDHLERTHPLRLTVGELAEAGRVLSRLSLPGLSRAAVAELAGPRRATGVDPGELHEHTAGNPFFVTEVLGAGTVSVPHSVRDAVLARAARLSGPARDLLDVVAVVPGQVENWLLEALTPTAMDSLDECVDAGTLTASAGRVRFRHEIARVVVEESLSPGRRITLHRRALSVLEKEEPPADPARLAYHADAAGDAVAILRYAPAAAAAAASAGAHREAARLYARALEFADRLPGRDRVGLLERYAQEAYFTAAGPEPAAALRDALGINRSRGDLLAQGRTLRLLGLQLGREGKIAESAAAALEAVTILEQVPPSAELALSYVNLAAVRGIGHDPSARDWGERAISLGEQTGCAEAVYAGLNLVGSIEITRGDLTGTAKLERSRDMAGQHRDYFHAGRAHLHLCWLLALRREWPLAESYLDPAINFCQEHGQEPWLNRLRSIQADSLLARGRWDEAAAAADPLLGAPDGPPAPTRCHALAVLATARARRGQAGCWPLLDEAAELAKQRVELAYLRAPVAAARAEAAWLEGRLEAVVTEAGRPDPVALQLDPFAAHDLACWRWRAGAAGNPDERPGPYGMLLAGDWAGAAGWWQQREQPYEAALASVGSGDADALRRALDVLSGLGAKPAVAIVMRELRGLGERSLPRPPRPATSAHPAGLTPREADVLGLLAAGLRNQEIAARLIVSPRTVDHHVSAILRKLNADNRGEAIAVAVRLGLVSP